MNNLKQKLITNYWLTKIKNFSPVITESFLRKKETILITYEDLLYFSKLTNENAIAEYTFLLSVFNALLCRYFDVKGLIYSLKKETRKTPLLIDFKSIKTKTFKKYLQEIKKEVLEAYKYSGYEKEFQDKNPFEKYATYSFLYNQEATKCDLSTPLVLSAKKTKKGLELLILFNDYFVNPIVINHFLRTFRNWILNCEYFLDENIENLPILTQVEKSQLLDTFNDTRIEYPGNKTLKVLFEEQVVKTPDNIALIFGDKELTYKELNGRANQLAAYLQENYDIRVGDLVGIKLERSENLLVVILGVLKVGAAYVPIDINYPQNRIDYIEKDSNCKVVIDADYINDFDIVKEQYSTKNISNIFTTNDLAYIIYTSGTTGNPKGVKISNKNAVALIHWAQKEFKAEKFDVVYAVTSHCFDLSIYEFFYPLSIGKKIRLLNDALEIGQVIDYDKNVLINTVPSSIRNLFESGVNIENANIINLAGESFPIDIANKLLKTKAEIRNLYGPSEDTTYSTIYRLSSEKKYTGASIPIGKPISNTQVYILDENLELLPVGVSGRLYISGDGLAKGYLNQEELTAEKFIENPFNRGQRMYDTGDIVRWLPDGNIEFLGRKDHQVKLRGYRIELPEIENSILSYSEGILQVVAITKDEKLLVYYTQNTQIDTEDLKKYLKDRLPIYMVPNHYKVLESIPLTPNGKIDRKALAGLPKDYKRDTSYVAPRNGIEQDLVVIWQKVLGLNKVGVTDNFFELGGHSLMIGQVINQIYKKLGCHITYKAFFQDSTIKSISKALKKENYISIPSTPKQEYYPLTPAQHRIWVLSQLEGGNIAYNMPGVVALKGELDVNMLRSAFDLLIDKHEILRTCFNLNGDGELSQCIADKELLNFDITLLDFQDKTKKIVDNYLNQEQSKPFDLTKAPLLRAYLLNMEKNEYLFSFVMHHIIGDGWSIELLISEVITIYNELLKNKNFENEVLSLQYKDYSVWLQSQLDLDMYRVSESYWLKKFQGELPILDLPSFKKRPLIQTYNGKTVNHQFSKAFLSRLKEFSRTNNATLFMTLMAGVNALLYRYTGQDDIVLGTPIAGREHPDLEHQIGLYLNTMAIRTQLRDSLSFKELLQQQRKSLLEAYEHQSYPFDALISKLNVKHDTSRSALFDVMVVLQNQNQVQSISSTNLTLEGLEVEKYDLKRNTSQLDVSFTFVEENGKLNLEIEYNTDIYDEFLITRMFLHFENLINLVIDRPKEKLSSIDYLTVKESKQILKEFSNEEVNFPKEKTIVDLFGEQVVKTPDEIAIIFDENKLTYTELNERANQLAIYLRRNYDIQPDDLLAIKLDRGENLLVAILGILKSGGAYVPIDTNYPDHRIDYIEKDSNAKVIIDKSLFDQFEKEKSNYNKKNIVPISSPANLAYVIYTSGTTGNPKGVMITHRNVVSIYSDWKKQYALDTFKINLLQLASVSFDVFVGDICRSLLNGGTMIIPTDHVKLNPEDLYKLIEKHQVSIFEGTPGLLLPLLDYIKRNNKKYNFLRRIIFGSDSFNNEVFNNIKDQFESTDLKVINSYGATEATIDSTFYDEHNSDLQGTTPIGKPFPNSSVYILDSFENPVPIGVYGELYIGGAGVSKGYYNRPELTQSKFINIKHAKNKVYATGDIGRWLPDGNIEFLGRNDYQVKVRGYRIELGEIESVLNEFSDDINQVVVSVKEINSEKTLMAYYVSSALIEKTELKSFLLEKLPDYMVPSFFIQLEKIPLTPNGKIDKNQLPTVTEKDVIKNTYMAPRNETENRLTLLWKELLQVDAIGIRDDFFELGGHSLKITKLKNRIAKTFDVSLSFNDLFLKTTIGEQATLITNASHKEYQGIPKAPAQEYYPLSSSQLRIWMLSQFEGSSIAYNMSGVFDVKGTIKSEALQKAFDTLVQRHEVLRTQFIQKSSGEVWQKVLGPEETNFKLAYKFQNKDTSNKNIKETIENEVKYTFDLEKECLLRASLLQIKENQFVLVVVIHHIISDGWSIDLLTNELFTLYNAYIHGNENPLEPLSIQYKDFAVWEQKELDNSKYNHAKEYWSRRFSGKIPVLELPYKQKRPLYKTYEGRIKNTSFSDEKIFKLKLLCRENNSTLFMGLMTLVKILLYRYTNQKNIIIGSPIAGRENIQLQDQLGAYVNTLALLTQFDGKHSFLEVLQKVKLTTMQAYANQSYPFDRLIEDLKLPRNLNRNPLFDIMVTLQNTDQEQKEFNFIDGIVINEIQVSDEIACKFDLDFVFEEIDEGIKLSLIYNTSLFDDDFIVDFCNQFGNLIENSIKTPQTPIHDLQILTSREHKTLLNKGTSVKNIALDSDKTFLNFFKDWTAETPDAIALQDNKTQLTYDELDRKSDGIAVYLNKVSPKKETTIGVVLDRSVSTVVVLLGILKSGKAYIPLDPTFPIKRLEFIVSNSGTKTLIWDEQFSFFDNKEIRMLTTSTLFSEINHNKLIIDTKELPKAKDTAYIIYTSGSTGNPKGVEVGHYSLMNFLLSIKEKPGIQAKDVLYAVTTYSFDISILEFFVPLISGAVSFIAHNETLSDAQKIIEDIERVKPNIIQAAPSFYQLLFNAGWKGNKEIKILCGGDSLSEALASQLLSSSKELWNMYGPTETTIWSSTKQVKKPGDSYNIGNAIDNTSLYVLGEHKELLPKGAQGVLYIGGDGQAKGYYKNKLLTKEKFIKNPFGKGLLYDTGDIVRWNSEDELLFLGRNDYQVKIRGYRIELGDIETKLNFIDNINQAIVIAKRDALDEAVLIAFYTSDSELKTSELKKQLKKVLPDYMIPNQFVLINEFPLTPNKKIDRKALSEMHIRVDTQKEYKEPITEIEKKLENIWKEFFELEKISINDNFFDLGGHSLTATKLVSRVQQEFSAKTSINKIFEHPTLEEQARIIENIQLLNQKSAEEDIETQFENFTI
ncbi:non-ribosomal peptide synthetase [Aquimarina sp. RZ0]|uniref:non-ribosomal peptide synthetase n=1 Tax=Aquimarina sp. RZ0 TaxID=2607730 RepID=UPI0011F37314|nr:non-ribosomal peptide synthetase [Aquimarina sp. RZ0]KAA1243793.1 amino acid adenylation domain-containing protein [Aquimarina sp. RZ0]